MKYGRFLLTAAGLLMASMSMAQTKNTYIERELRTEKLDQFRKAHTDKPYKKVPVRESYHPERRARAVEFQRCEKK